MAICSRSNDLYASFFKIGIHKYYVCWFISDLTKFPDKYFSKDVEEGWYDWWESKGLFGQSKSSIQNKKFSMILPPPNITGHLHLGHTFTATVQDAIVRWYVQYHYWTLNLCSEFLLISGTEWKAMIRFGFLAVIMLVLLRKQLLKNGLKQQMVSQSESRCIWHDQNP